MSASLDNWSDAVHNKKDWRSDEQFASIQNEVFVVLVMAEVDCGASG